jgi:7-carboxy-7-deazaguanine synthase
MYSVNEIFLSVQGEGVRAGTVNVFLRFAGCNLTCKQETEGFDCDTEFVSHRKLSDVQILDEIDELAGPCKWIVATGGEPALQLDHALVQGLHERGYAIAIETNGTTQLPNGIDWICCSPKTAEHTLRVGPHVNELKYVRNYRQGIPHPSLSADYYLLSPAVQPNGRILQGDLEWCISLVKQYPNWRLSTQQHKQWRVR